MASSTSSEEVLSDYYTALDTFQQLITKIGLELRTIDVKVIKSLVVGKIPSDILNKIDHKEQYSALDLFYQLQQKRFLSPNNLSLLKQALSTAGRPDLAKELEEFGKTVTELKDAPPSQMNNLPAPSSVLLHLLLTGQRSSIAVQQIDGLKESICKNLRLKLSDVPYVRTDETNQEKAFVIFEFPRQTDKVNQLNLAATNKAEWLVDLGVLQLKVNDKATISIDESLQEIKPLPPREANVLGMKPGFHSLCEKAIDLVLVIEVSFSVNINLLKNMLKQCQSAINTMAQGFDMRLSIVTYGNHCETQPIELIAFLGQAFSSNFDFTSHIKNQGQRGGKGGSSGIADAMAKVVELITGHEVRQDATKLCILINTLVHCSTDLDYYECSHGNDAIKLCGTLADKGFPLYIFGVDAPSAQAGSRSQKEENYFFEGVAAIGGGKYFQLEDVKHLDQAITCVIRHDISIENQGKAASEIMAQEINDNHGLVSINDLPRKLKEQLNLKSCEIDGLAENGRNLKQISQIALRVSWAEDLEDAKKAVELMKKEGFQKFLGKPKDDSQTRSAHALAASLSQIGDSTSTRKEDKLSSVSKQVDLGKECKGSLDEKCSICLVEKREVDLEVAVRIVRRQLHRMVYYRRSNQEDQNE